MVELDEDYRAQDPIVKGTCVVESADPCKMRLAQMALRLGIADFSVARANTAGVGRQKRLETLAALRRQLSVANPGRIDPSVITKCGSEQFRREILADRCPLPLILRKCSSALRK